MLLFRHIVLDKKQMQDKFQWRNKSSDKVLTGFVVPHHFQSRWIANSKQNLKSVIELPKTKQKLFLQRRYEFGFTFTFVSFIAINKRRMTHSINFQLFIVSWPFMLKSHFKFRNDAGTVTVRLLWNSQPSCELLKGGNSMRNEQIRNTKQRATEKTFYCVFSSSTTISKIKAANNGVKGSTSMLDNRW